MQRWKGERGRRPREDRVQSTEYGGVKKTVQKCKSAYGRCKGGKVDDKITEYGVRITRQLGQHAVLTLPESTRLARSANPTRGRVKRGTGTGIYASGQSRLCIIYPPNAIRLRQYAVLSDPLIRGDLVFRASFVAFAPSLGPGRVIASGNVRAGLLHEVLQEVDIV